MPQGVLPEVSPCFPISPPCGAAFTLCQSLPSVLCRFLFVAFAVDDRSRAGCTTGQHRATGRVTGNLCLTVAPAASKPTVGASGDSVVVGPTTVPTPSYRSPSSTTVITAADIESHQYRTVPDALALVPGLNVVQTGGPGGQTSIFIRGTNSNHVKVLIDGIDVSNPSNPNQSFDFGQLLTGDIARIEVLRGPQSGLYGSDAIGGVISITTKTGSGPPTVTAMVEGGSFATFNQRVGLSGSQQKFNYAFNIQHWYSGSTPVTPLNQLAPGKRKETTTTTIT